MTKQKTQNIIQFPTIGDIPNAPDATAIYQEAGVVPGCGPDFFWFRSTPEILDKKQKNASAVILSASTAPKDPQRSWEFAMPFYRAYEIVTLERFLRDFDCYSRKALAPKSERECALRDIGYPDPEKAKRESLIAERHNSLVDRIRGSAPGNPPPGYLLS